MIRSLLFIVLSLLMIGFVVIFDLYNRDSLSLNFVLFELSGRLSLLFLGTLILGILLGIVVMWWYLSVVRIKQHFDNRKKRHQKRALQPLKALAFNKND